MEKGEEKEKKRDKWLGETDGKGFPRVGSILLMVLWVTAVRCN
jgi:hypothetical protein